MKYQDSKDGQFRLDGKSLYFNRNDHWDHIFTSHKIKNIGNARALLQQHYDNKDGMSEKDMEVYAAL